MHTSLALSLSLSHERVSCAEWQHATASSSMMQQEVQEQDKDTRHHRTCTGLATGIPLLPASTLCHWLVRHNPNAQYTYTYCVCLDIPRACRYKAYKWLQVGVCVPMRTYAHKYTADTPSHAHLPCTLDWYLYMYLYINIYMYMHIYTCTHKYMYIQAALFVLHPERDQYA
jgi:hypothetical protein